LGCAKFFIEKLCPLSEKQKRRRERRQWKKRRREEDASEKMTHTKQNIGIEQRHATEQLVGRQLLEKMKMMMEKRERKHGLVERTGTHTKFVLMT
jgi:hypothetical protein